MISEHYSRVLSERTKDGLVKFEQKAWTGGPPPYGYRIRNNRRRPAPAHRQRRRSRGCPLAVPSLHQRVDRPESPGPTAGEAQDSDPPLPDVDAHQRSADSHQRNRRRAGRLQPPAVQAQQADRPAGSGVAGRIGAHRAARRTPADHRRRNLRRSAEPAGSARPAPAGHRPASRPGLPAVHRDDLLRRVRRVCYQRTARTTGRVPLLQLRMPPAERPGACDNRASVVNLLMGGSSGPTKRSSPTPTRYRRRHRGSPEVDAINRGELQRVCGQIGELGKNRPMTRL